MKLNRWVWIGLMASITWCVTAAAHTHSSDVEQATRSAALAYKVCTYSKQVNQDKDTSTCIAERDKSRAIWMEADLRNAALVAIAPLPFAWLAVVILVNVIRAQIVGFRTIVPWRLLPGRKKGFVILCGIFCLLTAGFGLLWVGNICRFTGAGRHDSLL